MVFANNLEKTFKNENDTFFNPKVKERVDNSSINFFTKPENETDPLLTNKNELTILISKLKSRGAPGEDAITNKVIKSLPDPFIDSITDIFNGSFKLSYMPARWKKAIVIMIPKPMKNSGCLKLQTN